MLVRAFAKVNYALEVRGKREDGYHEISTVMQSVSLADEMEIEHAEDRRPASAHSDPQRARAQ